MPEQDNRYFLYARKSSESEERQVQSIDDQINRLTELAKSSHLEIVEVIKEAKSAKNPKDRPLFSEMLDRIEKGEANSILCWQINRLSRNPVDSGRIAWMLQKSLIKSIQTMDRQYLPEDNVLLFSVESGVANQFIIDLRKNTMRGMESKLQKGWSPNLARLGYMNDQLNKTIIKDPARYDQVKQVWSLMLTGNYSVRQILKIMNDDWGFRTLQRKQRGGKPLSLSGLYSLFYSKFYAGVIEWNGREYQGIHEPMITMEEYQRVQEILTNNLKTKPRAKRLEHPFIGIIRCGECQAMITGETKYKLIKTTGLIKRYDYYHCTHKRKYITCSQNKVIPEVELDKQIAQELERYTILPEFKDWAIEVLKGWNDSEINQRTNLHETRTKELLETQSQLDNLTKMRYRDLISDEEYLRERGGLQNRLMKLKQQLKETENRAEQWLDLTEKVFDFACNAHSKFVDGSPQIKKEIFTAMGSNFILKDSVLTIEPNKWFVPVLTSYKKLEDQYKRIVPEKSVKNVANTAQKNKNLALDEIHILWGA